MNNGNGNSPRGPRMGGPGGRGSGGPGRPSASGGQGGPGGPIMGGNSGSSNLSLGNSNNSQGNSNNGGPFSRGMNSQFNGNMGGHMQGNQGGQMPGNQGYNQGGMGGPGYSQGGPMNGNQGYNQGNMGGPMQGNQGYNQGNMGGPMQGNQGYNQGNMGGPMQGNQGYNQGNTGNQMSGRQGNMGNQMSGNQGNISAGNGQRGNRQSNNNMRGSNNNFLTNLLAIIGIGVASNRGNGGNTSGRGRGNNSQSSWKPWAFLAILILFGVFYKEQIPFIYDRTPEENFNLYLSEVETTNQYPLGRSRTGNDVYDKDLITADMIYEMGHDRYLIYVYTFNEDIDKAFNEKVKEYMDSNYRIPIYKLASSDALSGGEDSFFEGSPKVVEMMRLETTAIPIGEYRNAESWKKEWGK